VWHLTEKTRHGLFLLALPAIGLILAAWALTEARIQRAQTEAALVAQARALARTLGPLLSATTEATR
jgi:hypothetical protein